MPTQYFDDLTVHEKRRLVFQAVLRTTGTLAVVVAIYFLVPMDRPIDTVTVLELVLGSLVLFAVIVWQIRQIVRSKHPGIRAVEGLAFTLPLFILLFATTYYLDRKSTRLNSSHLVISYAVFCLKKKSGDNQEDVTEPECTRRTT